MIKMKDISLYQPRGGGENDRPISDPDGNIMNKKLLTRDCLNILLRILFTTHLLSSGGWINNGWK